MASGRRSDANSQQRAIAGHLSEKTPPGTTRGLFTIFGASIFRWMWRCFTLFPMPRSRPLITTKVIPFGLVPCSASGSCIRSEMVVTMQFLISFSPRQHDTFILARTLPDSYSYLRSLCTSSRLYGSCSTFSLFSRSPLKRPTGIPMSIF